MAELKRMGRRILLIALGLLIIIMSFTGFVNYMSFANNYNSSLANTYAVAGNELVRKIEYALLYGKPINNYYGMNETLRELKDIIPELKQVNIVSPDGDIIYDLNGFVRDSRLPDRLVKTAAFEQGALNEKLSYRFYGKDTYLFIKIKDNASRHAATLAMVFPPGTFLQLDSQFTKHLVTVLLIIALIAFSLLAMIFFRFNFFNQGFLNKKKILMIFIAVLGSAQLLFSGVNYLLFKNAYIDMAEVSRDFTQSIIEKNLESVYAKGLSLQNIEGFDKYLTSINDSLPQIDEISLVQSNQVEVAISYDYINRQMFKILLDMLTVLVISILFMVEITLFAVMIMSRESIKAAEQQRDVFDHKTSHGLVRTITFFVNISAYMALTFVPIVMNNLYQPIGGLTKDFVLGLPLSVEMLGGILAIIISAWSIKRRGWRSIFSAGALFLIAGNLLSGFSSSMIPYIISRGIAGLGLGYMLMTIRSLVVSLPENNAAIAEFSAGSVAGLNCGAVIGGMLAERVGYSAIFYLAAIIVIIPLFFVHRLMNRYEIEEREISSISAFAKFANFIADKKTIIFLACIFIPYFINGAFLEYLFPLFASGNKLSQSDISRGFLLNGLFIIYLGPVLTRYTAKKLGNLGGMIAAMFIVFSALMSFALLGTIFTAFAALILLGIAESFGVSLKTTYFLNLNGVKDLEINQGIAYFSSMVYLGRMAGPMIYGAALSLGPRMGVGVIAFAVLILLLVFIYFTRFKSGQSITSING